MRTQTLLKALKITALTASLVTSLAAHSSTMKEAGGHEFQEMVQRYYAATQQEADVEATLAQFQSWGEAHSDAPMTDIYIGALQCLQARDAFFPWSKVKYVNRCLDSMDLGVEKVKSSRPRQLAQAWLERGLVTASLPGMFNRQDTAVDDLMQVKNTPLWQHLPSATKERVEAALLSLKKELAQ